MINSLIIDAILGQASFEIIKIDLYYRIFLIS